jgi:hypothetical protein
MTLTTGTALAGILQAAVVEGDKVILSVDDLRVLELYAELKWPGFQEAKDCPLEYKEKLCDWARTGRPQGELIEGILRQDLEMIMHYADSTSLHYLQAIYKYAYDELPPAIWGNTERYSRHLNGGGIPGWNPKN